MSASPRDERVRHAVEAQQRDGPAGSGRAHVAKLAVAGNDRGAGLRRGAVEADRHGAGARGAAVLHARHHLLADIAAFFEIDAGELVHVGFVREGVAVGEIDPATRDAKRDAVRLVFVCLDQRRAKIGSGSSGEMRRQHHAHAERRQPRIGIAQANPVRAALAQRGRAGGAAVPSGEHAQNCRQILNDYLGAQLVEVEFFDQRRGLRLRNVEKKPAAILCRRFDDDEVGNDFALRRQQRAKTRLARLQVEDVGGDKPVEKTPRAIAGDLDHAAIGEKSSSHALSFPGIAMETMAPAHAAQGWPSRHRSTEGATPGLSIMRIGE